MNSLLPPNASGFERACEAAMARLGDVPVELRKLWNLATCPTELLPWLAWGLSIDSWDANWSESVRRARVAQAIAVQRRKGTSSAVRDVVTAFGGDLALREWWQTTPLGDPFTFNLVLSLSGADGDTASAGFVEQVIDEVTRTKPVRAHFTFTQALASSGGIGLVGAARPATFARVSLAA